MYRFSLVDNAYLLFRRCFACHRHEHADCIKSHDLETWYNGVCLELYMCRELRTFGKLLIPCCKRCRGDTLFLVKLLISTPSLCDKLKGR